MEPTPSQPLIEMIKMVSTQQPDYFDRLPTELISYILNLASDQALDSFQMQRQLITHQRLNKIWRCIQPRSTHYAIRTSTQLRGLIKAFRRDPLRGNDAKGLLIEGLAGGKLFCRLFDLVPNLEELELRGLALVRTGRSGNNTAGLGQILGGIATYESFLRLSCIKKFSYLPIRHDLIRECIYNSDIAKLFEALPNLIHLHLPKVPRQEPFFTTIAPVVPNPRFYHLSIKVVTLANRNQVQNIVESARKSLTRLELHDSWLDLGPIFRIPLGELHHLTCVARIPPGMPPLALDYLDKALPLLNLWTLEIGRVGYTDFCFLEKLVNLKEIIINFESYGRTRNRMSIFNLDARNVNRLLSDLEAHLASSHCLRNIRILLETLDPLVYRLESLEATCKKLGIRLEVFGSN